MQARLRSRGRNLRLRVVELQPGSWLATIRPQGRPTVGLLARQTRGNVARVAASLGVRPVLIEIGTRPHTVTATLQRGVMRIRSRSSRDEEAEIDVQAVGAGALVLGGAVAAATAAATFTALMVAFEAATGFPSAAMAKLTEPESGASAEVTVEGTDPDPDADTDLEGDTDD